MRWAIGRCTVPLRWHSPRAFVIIDPNAFREQWDLLIHDHLICLAGFEGTRCEIDSDDCVSRPCQNQGHCVDGVNSYRSFCLLFLILVLCCVCLFVFQQICCPLALCCVKGTVHPKMKILSLISHLQCRFKPLWICLLLRTYFTKEVVM